MIHQDIINSILAASKIEEVISDYVNIKKRGVNYVGCCPFHNEKTPSFVVSPAKNIFTCFGCGKTGNVFNFIMEHENISYPAAIKIVGAKYGITVTEKLSKEDQEKYGKRESIKNTLAWSAKYFSANILTAEAANYIKEREITKESIEEFKLGYAFNNWHSLMKCASENGYTRDNLLNSGLIRENDKTTYDYFRNRIMFPFMDISGNIIGFTGRILTEEKEQAKYLNSPDTELFSKGKTIYGLFQAKKHIVEKGFAYLVEGNVDVVQFHQKGLKNTIAGSGTAFTHEQAQLIKRFTDTVTMVYDGDTAGIKATFKNIDILIENGISVNAVILPDEEDPDSFAKKHSNEELEEYLKQNEKDFITLKHELMKSGKETPAEQTEILRSVIKTIALIPDKLERKIYQDKCSKKFGFPAEDVTTELRVLLSDKKKKQVDTTVNGWMGLEIATESIKENDECHITLDKQKFLDMVSGQTENTLFHSGKIENIHIQQLNNITENVIIIDSITTKDIEEDTKLLRLCKAMFKKRMNVKIMLPKVDKPIKIDDDENDDDSKSDGLYESFLDAFVRISIKYVKDNEGDDLIKKKQIENTADLLSYADNTIISISTSYISKDFGIKEAAFKNIMKPFLEKRKTNIKMASEGIVSEGEILQFNPEKLPDYVDKEFFNRYGYFPAQNSKGKKVAYVFRTDQAGLITVGNFYMEPLFHVHNVDPTKNKRIIQINNGEQNKQFYTEITSDNMIDFASFKKCMWREGGNVFSKGKAIHFEMILASLANRFPLCYELTTFGQQHEGFFAFTNAIFSNGEMKFTDEFGLVSHNDITYYSPAFSKIYSGQRKDDDKYEQDRFFVFKENKETDFATWSALMDKVYKANDNGKWALIMAILSAFRSIIYPIDRLFTSLFFVGPTESGKTQIAVSVRSLFMTPEAPLFNLNSGTDAAFFATLERFRDVPIVFEEYNDYQITDVKFQGLKAAVYDGEGKTKRKDATSKDLDVSKVNGVPVLLGQEAPERDDGSLGNRCVIKQVPKKSDWTEEEVAAFQELKMREKKGLSNILIDLLRIRPIVSEHFAKQQRIVFKELKNKFREKGITVENRITNTVSLFTAMVKVMELYAPHLKLPFTFDEFFELAQNQIIQQSEQILSTNRLAGFFESIEILMLRDKIKAGRDFKIESGHSDITVMINSKETMVKEINREDKLLYLRINNIHSHYMDMKRNEALKMQNLMTYIKDYPAYVGHVKSTRFEWTEVVEGNDPIKDYVTKSVNRASANTSAVVFNYNVLKENLNIDLEKYEEETSTSDVQAGEVIPKQVDDLPF